jgi:hypothetical protein
VTPPVGDPLARGRAALAAARRELDAAEVALTAARGRLERAMARERDLAREVVERERAERRHAEESAASGRATRPVNPAPRPERRARRERARRERARDARPPATRPSAAAGRVAAATGPDRAAIARALASAESLIPHRAVARHAGRERSVDLVRGASYRVEPLNPRRRKDRGRVGTLTGWDDQAIGGTIRWEDGGSATVALADLVRT